MRRTVTALGLFLAAINADEIEIETAFGEASKIAKKQKSISLQKRALAVNEAFGTAASCLSRE